MPGGPLAVPQPEPQAQAASGRATQAASLSVAAVTLPVPSGSDRVIDRLGHSGWHWQWHMLLCAVCTQAVVLLLALVLTGRAVGTALDSENQN